LLKTNPGLDKEAALVLFERALIVGQDGKVSFSRDKKLKTSVLNFLIF
jgi:hypothetical protein